MTTTTAAPNCARCSHHLFVDQETGEDFCPRCGHRPEWKAVPSIISDTSVDYMGTAFVAGVKPTDNRRYNTLSRRAVYGPPDDVQVETLYWTSTVIGARLPWGKSCFWPHCGFGRAAGGLCRTHGTVIRKEEGTLLSWKEAAVQQFGWTRVEYKQWRQGEHIYTQVGRVWWPKHISLTTTEIIFRVMEKFKEEKGYPLRRFRAVLDSRNSQDTRDLYLVDWLSDTDLN